MREAGGFYLSDNAVLKNLSTKKGFRFFLQRVVSIMTKGH
jgi:hypothetical protein